VSASPGSSARHVRRNRRYWDSESERYQREHAAQLERRRPVWGVWGIPEKELGALGDVAGLDVLEYGCGGAQWCRWLLAMGARPVGLDVSLNQLRYARSRMRSGRAFAVVTADAERTPFADASFDLVMCDHGAMTFCDPNRTVPEVARLLRPGGRLVFNHASPFQFVCWDDDTERLDTALHRDYFGMRRWDEGETVDFMLPFGEWIRLFRSYGFEVEDLIEPRPSPDATTTYPWFATRAWARRYPAESLWKLRRGR